MNPSTPKQLVEPLRQLVESRRVLHERDLANGEASVWLPYALDRKYPSTHKELKWQFLFKSAKFSRDPKTGKRHRHHLHSDTFPVHLRRAVQQTNLNKHVTSHTFDIRLLPTCCKMGPIFEPFKSCSAIATSRRR